VTVDPEAIRQMASSLRDTAENVRDLGNGHMNETLSMHWVSASATAFTSRTVSDHIAVLNAAVRIDELADALVAHADAADVAAAEEAAAAAQGDGPGRLAI
jgi:uncharacterized protein YukE